MSPRCFALGLSFATFVGLCATALGRDEPAGCTPGWIPTFGTQPGLDAHGWGMAVFDDGNGGGPALYVSGPFMSAGDAMAMHIAKWDGASWSAVGGGLNDWVTALVVFDDGNGGGPALYAGGQFTQAGGQPASRVAKWDGSSWSALGAGVGGTYPYVSALAVFDDGQGPALYAAGQFTTAGGQPANRIAKWDGASWSALGSGLSSPASTLATFDDGNGEALYAGGEFTLAGGQPANRIAKWDGAAWAPVGGGVAGPQAAVFALSVFDVGAGEVLCAGGRFTSAGGNPANGIAKWNGASWSSFGSGTCCDPLAAVYALAEFDAGDGAGPALYAGGSFGTMGGLAVNRIAKWNGASWSAVGTGVSSPSSSSVGRLVPFDDGSGAGPALYATGAFDEAGGTPATSIARWDGAQWSPLAPHPGLNDPVHALATLDAGGVSTLWLGGQFTRVQGIAANHVARWNGVGFAPLGSGTDNVVHCLSVFDDGEGPALFAGGDFTSAGGVPASRIARWDGASWSPLGSGLEGLNARASVVFDDGNGGGPALFVGGLFLYAGGVLVKNIAKWDGESWSNLGSGTNAGVRALAVYDDGSGGGPALYAGGVFTGAGGAAAHIAKWDGASWSPLRGGLDERVFALAVFDDGNGGGPALYAGGMFTAAGGVPALYVASWDGVVWSPVGGGMDAQVTALAVHDDGRGPGLYAGGAFSIAGGVAADRIARWDGVRWSPLGSGTNERVLAIASLDDGTSDGPALIVGVEFAGAGDSGDSYLARWGCAAGEPGTPYCFGDGSGAACPCDNASPTAGDGCANSSGDGARLSAIGSAQVANDTLRLVASGMIGNQPGLLFQAQDALGGGQGIGFGDGLRCAGNGVIRLEVVFPDVTGRAVHPEPGEDSISIEGQVQPGDTRRYQLWYRDAVGGPCGSGFNVSNGYAIDWQ